MKRFVLILLAAVFAGVSHAREALVIDLGDERIKSRDRVETIDIKKQLRRAHGQINFDRLELNRIYLVAKSKSGRGQAWLSLRSSNTAVHPIGGERQYFNSSDPDTFDHVVIGPTHAVHGSEHWQLKVRGDLRIREIVIVMNDCAREECYTDDPDQGVVQLTLDYDDLEIKNYARASGILIQRELEKAYGRVDFDHLRLVNIALLAKSADGEGQAWLVVGSQPTAAKTVRGRASRFESRDTETFDRVVFAPPNPGDTAGRWILMHRGHFKVRKLTVEMIDCSKVECRSREYVAQCTAANCPKGTKVKGRAQGPRTCYTASDGRWIDKRNGALVSYIEGCKDGRCVQREEICYESRTCTCANGQGQCKRADSCSVGPGCRYGHVTLRMHCPSSKFVLE